MSGSAIFVIRKSYTLFNNFTLTYSNLQIFPLCVQSNCPSLLHGNQILGENTMDIRLSEEDLIPYGGIEDNAGLTIIMQRPFNDM